MVILWGEYKTLLDDFMALIAECFLLQVGKFYCDISVFHILNANLFLFLV